MKKFSLPAGRGAAARLACPTATAAFAATAVAAGRTISRRCHRSISSRAMTRATLIEWINGSPRPRYAMGWAAACMAIMVLPAASAASTPAPVRAAQVQIVDDDSHGSYQEEQFCLLCTQLPFSAVPAGHRRTIEHLSCQFTELGTGGNIFSMSLSAAGGAHNFFSPTAGRNIPASFVSAALSLSVVNSPALLSFSAGDTPVVGLSTYVVIQQMICTLSGRDIVLP